MLIECTTPSTLQRTTNFHGNSVSDDSAEFHLLNTGHERVYHELQNRYAALESIRKSMRYVLMTYTNDVIKKLFELNRNQEINIMGALKQSIKTNDRSVLVDLLGAIIEKS